MKKKLKIDSPKPPQFFHDLYRDLRDRRLLIPAIALVAALLAIPVLLSSSPEESVAPPTSSSETSAAATAVEAAVLADDAGIRDYRKRLEALKQRNPFTQKFATPTAKSVAIAETTEASSGGLSGGGSSSGADSISSTDIITETGTGGGSSMPSGVTDTTVTDTTTIDGNSSTSVESDEVKQPKPPPRFYAGRVDVTVGPLGEAKTLEDVHPLHFLPGRSRPVVSFLGIGKTTEHAIFSVNPGVSESKGEGSCVPKHSDRCQFLDLKVGQERRFKYGPNSVTYRLKLLDARLVRIPDPRDR